MDECYMLKFSSEVSLTSSYFECFKIWHGFLSEKSNCKIVIILPNISTVDCFSLKTKGSRECKRNSEYRAAYAAKSNNKRSKNTLGG